MARKIAGNLLALLLAAACAGAAQQSYPGFDRNDYPGDAALPALRKDFRYTGYWLNPPSGESRDTWTGKRALLKRYGFGFLVLFNGRADAELQGRDAAAIGASDGKTAVALAARQGFPPNVLIFLDQEEGGRLLPEQTAYLFAWIDAVRAAGARAGVYCSGIPVPDGHGKTITTAQDIAERLAALPSSKSKGAERSKGRGAERVLWVADDRCPPSPGCSLSTPSIATAFSPAVQPYVAAWQYAQSPRRARFSAACPANQDPGGNCYAPGLPQGANSFVDLNAADSPDPSEAP
jgi:hypothetical protein